MRIGGLNKTAQISAAVASVISFSKNTVELETKIKTFKKDDFELAGVQHDINVEREICVDTKIKMTEAEINAAKTDFVDGLTFDILLDDVKISESGIYAENYSLV